MIDQKNNPKFVVLAFRHGGKENVFPIGVFDDLDSAKNAARNHHFFRGGKYLHRIYEFPKVGKMLDDVGHLENSKPCIEER
jgi:hypothetical protein